ncbi:MAG TPA: FtsX-like permease family protein [Anaerolineae bacterium]|nr:FtsX-like permease family protein [Anaerolineae bacterium]HQH37779.1 FtsX-like permease family protein [Anaerolineae bacterium]
MRILRRARAIFIIVIKRIISQPGLVLATTLGLVIAIALMMSIPMYADAVYRRVFLENIAGAAGDTPNVPPLTYLFRYDGSLHGALEWEEIQPVHTYLTTGAGAELGITPKFAASYFTTEPFGIYANATSLFRDNKVPLLWASFATISDLANHITLLEGRFPNVASTAQSEPIEVLIYEELATRLGLQVDETYIAYLQVRGAEGLIHDVQFPLHISGIWQATDPQESFWFIKPVNFAERLIVPEETFSRRLSSQLTGEIYTGMWSIVAETRDIDHNDAMTLIRNGIVVQQRATGLLPNIKLARSPLEALINYQNSANFLTLLLYAFSIPILALLLAFITLTSGLAVEQRRNEVAVLRSRGAGVLQMVGIATLESLLLGLVALALSIPIGMTIATLIGQTRSFLDFSAQRTPLPISLTPTALNFGLIGVALGVAAQVLPTFGAAQYTVVSYKREIARTLRKPWWQRAWLDGLLLIVAAYGAYLLRQQGSLVALEDTFGATPYQNPLLFLVPALGIFALTLFFLRLIPLAMSLIAWIAGRTKAVGLVMGSRHLARTPGFYTTPLILLVLTLSLSAFTASLASTLDHHLYDQMYYAVGADMQFMDMGEGTDSTVLTMSTQSSSGLLTAEEEPSEENTGPRWLFRPLTDYLNAAGVERATRVGQFPAYMRIGNATPAGVFMGIDRTEFAQIAFWRRDFATESLGGLMNALAMNPQGVLVPQDFLQEQSLLIGDNIRLVVTTYGQNNEIDFKIVGTFNLFPTWYPSTGPLFVGNLDYLFENAGGQFPYSVWLDTVPDADYADLGNYSLSGHKLDWTAALPQIRAEQQLPERQGLFGLLSVGFSAAAGLTVLGFLLYALFSFRRRFIEFGVLRAVGLSSTQMTAFLGWELAFLILTGGVLGTGLGAFISQFFIPFLQIGVDEASRLPPYTVDIAWPAIFRIYVLFGILFVVALVALVMMLRRMKIFQAIKLGETA